MVPSVEQIREPFNSRRGSSGRVDVDRMDVDVVHAGRDDRRDCPDTAAQVDHDVAAPDGSGSSAREQLGASPRHEDAGSNYQPPAPELRPSHDLLERQAGCSPRRQEPKFVIGTRGGRQHVVLILGEDAAGLPQLRDELRPKHAVSASRRYCLAIRRMKGPG